MQIFNTEELKKLYVPPAGSHKGQNGKLLIIGGSHLFHAASLWALTIASKIVDMVFYSSVSENNQFVSEAKREFRNGIVVLRENLEDYIDEADCVLIGPGMMRTQKSEIALNTASVNINVQNLKDISKVKDEGKQTYYLTKYLLEKYPTKKWVIDAGALQMLDPEWLRPLEGRAVLTPHVGEFERLESKIRNQQLRGEIGGMKVEEKAGRFAKEYNCIVLLKGHEDVACSWEKCVKVVGGNAGMTKGGTGDVLAGLVGALSCKNDLWLSAISGSYINKKAGDSLFEKVGYFFNASDLADEIPRVMGKIV